MVKNGIIHLKNMKYILATYKLHKIDLYLT